MKTYFVLIPNAPGQRLAVTLHDNYQIFEVSEDLIEEVKRRPVMPGITRLQNCRTREEVFALAKNES